MQLEIGKWRLSREHTLPRIKGNPTCLGDRKIRTREEVGEVGKGSAFHNKEFEFYAKGDEASTQQSDGIRCVFKKKHYSSCRREEIKDMVRLRLRGTINHGSYADWT